MKLFVEGGGSTNALRTECREGFARFIAKAGVARKPRIVACGSRREAFDDFCTEIGQGREAMLLVDSEAPIAAKLQEPADRRDAWKPWQHLLQRPGDGWQKPRDAQDGDCHLMVQAMETWLLADREALSEFFGAGFNGGEFPAQANPVERLSKDEAYAVLKGATRRLKTKDPYSKGAHSFKLLARVDPAKVTAACPWAMRFVESLKARSSL